VIVIKFNCYRSANKSNHPIQIPLLLVTKTRTRDKIYSNARNINVIFSLLAVGLASLANETSEL
jgi:hypothetical protein